MERRESPVTQAEEGPGLSGEKTASQADQASPATLPPSERGDAGLTMASEDSLQALEIPPAAEPPVPPLPAEDEARAGDSFFEPLDTEEKGLASASVPDQAPGLEGGTEALAQAENPSITEASASGPAVSSLPPAPPSFWSRLATSPWLALLLYVVMIAITIVPKHFKGSLRILGHADADTVKHLWNLWWFKQMILVDHKLPFATDYLNYPYGFQLYPIEPFNGVPTLLLAPLFGLPWTSNILAVLNLALGAWGMFFLARELTGRHWASLMAGLIFGLSSYAVWTVFVGVGELSNLVFMPLALMYQLRLARDGGWKNLLLGALFFFCTAFSCWYYALFLALIGGALMCTDFYRGRQTFRLWGRYLALGMLSVGPMLPIMGAFNQSYTYTPPSTEPIMSYVVHRLDSPPRDKPHDRIDLRNLLFGGAEVRRTAVAIPYEGGRYLGLALVFLAALGFLTHPKVGIRWLLPLSVALVLSMGSQGVFAGTAFGVVLPFAYLNLAFERLGHGINFPARFIMPVTLMVVVLAGLGLSFIQARLEGLFGRTRLPRKSAVVAGLVILVGILPVLEGRARGDVPVPLPSRWVTALPAAQVIAKDPESVAVIEFPQVFQEQGRLGRDEILLMQLVHGKKSAALPLDRISTFVMSGRQELKGQPLMITLLHLAGTPEPDRSPCCMQEPPNSEYVVAQRKWLVDRGFKYLAISFDGVGSEGVAGLRQFATHVFGPPLLQTEQQDLYQIQEKLQEVPTR